MSVLAGLATGLAAAGLAAAAQTLAESPSPSLADGETLLLLETLALPPNLSANLATDGFLPPSLSKSSFLAKLTLEAAVGAGAGGAAAAAGAAAKDSNSPSSSLLCDA